MRIVTPKPPKFIKFLRQPLQERLDLLAPDGLYMNVANNGGFDRHNLITLETAFQGVVERFTAEGLKLPKLPLPRIQDDISQGLNFVFNSPHVTQARIVDRVVISTDENLPPSISIGCVKPISTFVELLKRGFLVDLQHKQPVDTLQDALYVNLKSMYTEIRDLIAFQRKNLAKKNTIGKLADRLELKD